MRPRRPSGEEGASATAFVIVLSTLLGVAMLALDGGSLFLSRRGQVADTDSAALAVAQHLIDQPCDWNSPPSLQPIAEDYAITKNGSDLVTDVTVTPTTTNALGCALSGVVQVSTERDATLFFAPIFGTDRAPTAVTTGAVYGDVFELSGLRPMGICVEDPHYDLEWEPALIAENNGTPLSAATLAANATIAETAYRALRPELFFPAITSPPIDEEYVVHPTQDQNGNNYPASSIVHRVTFSDTGATDFCGDGPAGNFGWLDFDGNGGGDVSEDCDGVPSPQSELNCDIGNGFQGQVRTPPSADCDPTSAESLCLSEPGKVNAASAGLGKIMCPSAASPASDCEPLYIVVYDEFSGTPPPGVSEAQFELAGVVSVVLRDFNVATAPRNPNTNYLDLELVNQIVVGTVGPSSTTSTGPKGVVLCRVGDFDNCDYGP